MMGDVLRFPERPPAWLTEQLTSWREPTEAIEAKHAQLMVSLRLGHVILAVRSPVLPDVLDGLVQDLAPVRMHRDELDDDGETWTAWSRMWPVRDDETGEHIGWQCDGCGYECDT